MDVLLIYPNVSLSGIEDKIKVPPLGLAYIAAVLEENGYDVEILDMYAQPTTSNKLRNILRTGQPEIVGITCLTPFVSMVLKIARMVKENLNAKVVVGGAHATALPEEMLEENCIDYVVLGEGEYTTLELVTHVLEGENRLEEIKGIAYLNEGEFHRTKERGYIENLDELPFPARRLLSNDRYSATHYAGKRITTIITSRGCPYSCMFCDYRFLMGPRFRRRSPENVLDEIEECIAEYDTDYINFRDSTFTFDEKWITNFCKMIKERKMDIRWDCNGRVNLVTKKMLKELNEAGCTLISYGIESGDQNILDFANKKSTVEQSINAVKMTKEAGIEVLSYFIIGLPGENWDSIKKTIDLSIKLESDYTQFSLATPYPGTPLFEYAKENNLIKDGITWKNYSLMSGAIMRTEELNYDDLEKAIRLAYREYYWRLRYILRRLGKLRPDNIKRNISGLEMFLKAI